MFKKIILSLLVFAFYITTCMANPIPVFCMFNYGFIKNSQEWSKACESVSNSLYEREYSTDKNLKRYVILGSSIYERDYNTDKNLKRYVMLGSSIYEREYNTDKNLKRYVILGSSIYERDYNTDKNLKRFVIY